MSSLDFEQDLNQKLVEIGAHLREIRHQHNMSLDEISASTLIPTRLLHAIEDGNMEKLPEPVYTKGFIRRFGDALGLNGITLAEGFPITAKPLPQYKAKPGGRLKAGLRPIHLYLFYILMIVAAGVGLSYLNKQSTQTLGGSPQTLNQLQDLSPTPAASSMSPQLATGNKHRPANSPSAAVTATPLRSSAPNTASAVEAPKLTTNRTTTVPPVRVDLTLKQDAWVEIEVDGQTKYQGLLKAKTNKTVMAQEKIVIHSGNAGGVLISANEKPAQPMGELGTLKSLTVDRNT